jgi:hypothetical protein
MKRVAVALICVTGLLASLPSFAAEQTPPAAPSNAVSPTLPLAAPAPAPAPLPSWLAPPDAQPMMSSPPDERADPQGRRRDRERIGITPCTIEFCEACPGEQCFASSRGCVCCT